MEKDVCAHRQESPGHVERERSKFQSRWFAQACLDDTRFTFVHIRPTVPIGLNLEAETSSSQEVGLLWPFPAVWMSMITVGKQ